MNEKLIDKMKTETTKSIIQFLVLCLTFCAPRIYKEQPGFVPIKDISGNQVEYFPEKAKYLGFKENFHRI
ncbi:MAG: hypothetical protein IPO06_26015 [Leptospiraceae bacterium]|nr:hypothetical protein [Leptospiraceae bacterium]